MDWERDKRKRDREGEKGKKGKGRRGREQKKEKKTSKRNQLLTAFKPIISFPNLVVALPLVFVRHALLLPLFIEFECISVDV